MLRLSPLQIVKYGLWRSHLSVVETLLDGGEAKVSVDVETAIGFSEEGVWQVSFGIRTNDESRGQYAFDFEMRGQFRLEPPPPADRERMLAVAQFVARTGGALLYSALREHMLAISGRAMPGAFVLPAVDVSSFEHGSFTDAMIDRAVTYYSQVAERGLPRTKVEANDSASRGRRKNRPKKK